ncbi:class I SAM-dependent methyltransferase [Phenylobacterium sp. J367]|uniref:class I SAM-dependent methyltransferase n=1 Tax=Phenylobacterium sp. J367 TaxID=2898435 RepID=UPI002150C2B3|nr:class I SAM-dependent methyltransferase [Phenylobacterium sp. J367]MCR5880984.1 class I SAM-dependent methyltransferase [Phenylobacterium sp. J367]
MAALAPSAGERLLDIGCGAGETTIELAERVQPGGAVVGLDISRPLLEAARARAAPSGVEFIEADAQTHAFPPGSFDGVFSRFGVMFFADPVAAFTNIRRALKSGGRLAFVCWRAAAENPVMTTPMAAAAHLLPPLPRKPIPRRRGPSPSRTPSGCGASSTPRASPMSRSRRTTRRSAATTCPPPRKWACASARWAPCCARTRSGAPRSSTP